MTPPPARPVYLKSGSEIIFGLFHAPPPGASPARAVLICAPWGWDETASYRSRRLWAERLSEAGHPTLRFDLPSVGDSSGIPSDPARVKAWVAAIVTATEWLQDAGGGAGVAVLGLGLGGLLARVALSDGAPIEDLVLWAAPIGGRIFVRETRAFSRLQPWGAAGGGDRIASQLPDGWLEAGGFVLTAQTLEDLAALEPAFSSSMALRRALLLDRDGIAADPSLREDLEGAGVEVTADEGDGWGAMVAHPERTVPPLAVFERVESWLAEEGGEESAGEPDLLVHSAAEALELEVGGRRIRESALTVELPFGRAFGVLGEPIADPVPGLCGIFFNAGAIRHIGPNRIWTETARQWAARGLRTLRVDLEAIGEADGDGSKLTEVAEFYVPQYEDQISSVLDALEEQGLGSRFLLVGLCVGGYWSFRTALRDRRTAAALLLNAGALVWHSELLAEREARKLGRVFERRWWHKLSRGEVGLARLRALAASLLARLAHLARSSARRLTGRGEALEGIRSIATLLDLLRETEIPVVMAFSGDEPLYTDLEAADIPAHLDRWPNVELGSLPGYDHTLRPIAAQRAARELLDHELARVLDLEGP